MQRYVASGGGFVTIRSHSADFHKYQWPMFHALLRGEFSYASQINNLGIISMSFGKGQVVIVNLESLTTDEQKVLISEVVSKTT